MLHNYHVRVDLKVLWSRKLQVRGQGRKLARKYHFALETNQSKCWGVLRSSPGTFWPLEPRCQFGFMDFREFFGVRPKDVGFKQTVIIKNIIKDRCESTHQRKSWKRALVVPSGSHSNSGAPQEKLNDWHCQNSEDLKRRLPLIMFDFENSLSTNTKSEHKNELLSSKFQVLFFGLNDEK